MARSHKMTPARRAALRKAQLVSARKRRRRGVKKEIKRAVRQTGSAARAGGSLASRKAVRRWNAPAAKASRKRTRRRVIKAGAITATVGAAGTGAVVLGGYRTINRNIATTGYHRTSSGKVFTRQGGPKITRVRSKSARVASHQPIRTPRAVTGRPTRALTMGPKGKSTVRSRNYRARKKASR